MKVRYTETALRELDEILAYIADRNFTAAASVRARVEELVERLSYFPYLAQGTERNGVRRVPLGNYPYVIFYTVEAEEVVILRIRHGARRPLWDTE
jgi:toxin ParE1/3/4